MVVVRVLPAADGTGASSEPKTQSLLRKRLCRSPTHVIISQGLQNLLDRIERMRALGPEFIDITWYVFQQHLEYKVWLTGT